MYISIVAAMTPETHVIGSQGDIPWNVPSDLKRFKKITLNSPIIMGRKTYESIGRPLPKRKNYIITRNKSYMTDGGCIIFHDLQSAIDDCEGYDDVYIIGGGEIYKEAMKVADNLLLSFIMAPLDLEGDAFFPRIGEEWDLTSIEFCEKGEKDEYDHYYAIFNRK